MRNSDPGALPDKKEKDKGATGNLMVDFADYALKIVPGGRTE
jgi:hypothetical protein